MSDSSITSKCKITVDSNTYVPRCLFQFLVIMQLNVEQYCCCEYLCQALQQQRQTMISQMDTYIDLNLEQKVYKFNNKFNINSLGSHYVHISCYSCSLDINLTQLICPSGTKPHGVSLCIIKTWIHTNQNRFIQTSVPAAASFKMIVIQCKMSLLSFHSQF